MRLTAVLRYEMGLRASRTSHHHSNLTALYIFFHLHPLLYDLLCLFCYDAMFTAVSSLWPHVSHLLQSQEASRPSL